MALRESTYRCFARLVLALCTAVCAATASGAAPYSFDAPDQYLTRADDYPRWAALWLHHLEQTQALDACLSDAAQCADYLKGYREIVVSAHDLSAPRKMALVNRFINGRHWRVESGQHDDWRTLTDFLRYGGDCEDYAIAKYFALRQLGFSADDVRVGITWDFETSAYHAVTVVRIDGQIYFLDVDGAPHRHEMSYRFLFSINEIAVWDHVAKKTAMHVQKSQEDRS